MIDLRELRYGNYIKSSKADGVIQVYSIGDMSVNNWQDLGVGGMTHVPDILGIPLSDELMEKCEGAYKMIGYNFIVKHPFNFMQITVAPNTDNDKGWWYFIVREGREKSPRDQDSIVFVRRDMQYLHTLQNLFFDVTKDELKIAL